MLLPILCVGFWTWTTPRPRAQWKMEAGYSGIIVSPGGGILAAQNADRNLKLWDLITGQEKAHFIPEPRPANELEFRLSADGRYIIFERRGKRDEGDSVHFWNVNTQKIEAVIAGDLGSMMFAGDGKRFAIFADQTVQFWMIGDRQRGTTLIKEHKLVAADNWAFSPDLNSLAILTYPRALDGEREPGPAQIEICELNRADVRPRVIHFVKDANIHSMAFSADGNFLCTQDDFRPGRSKTFVWDVGNQLQLVRIWDKGAVLSPDGKWVLLRDAAGADLVETTTSRQWARLEPPEGLSQSLPGDFYCQ